MPKTNEQLRIELDFITDVLNTLEHETFDSPDEILVVLQGQKAYLSRQLKQQLAA